VSEWLHNMSVPAKTAARIHIDPVGTLMVFDPGKLAQQLGCARESLPGAVNAYVRKHPIWNKRIAAPTGFMISSRLDGPPAHPKAFFEVCKDIGLQLLVFGSTAGSLYIPGRTVCWDPDKFEQKLMFLKSEVFQ